MSILPDSLELAITLCVTELRQQPLGDLVHEFEATRSEVATLLGEKGDLLMYGSPKKGEVAEIFNRVARTIALMSIIVQGGITVFGRHFENPHPEMLVP